MREEIGSFPKSEFRKLNAFRMTHGFMLLIARNSIYKIHEKIHLATTTVHPMSQLRHL